MTGNSHDHDHNGPLERENRMLRDALDLCIAVADRLSRALSLAEELLVECGVPADGIGAIEAVARGEPARPRDGRG